MSFDLIIFDCDGVLVDSEGLGNYVLAKYLTELGFATEPEESIEIFRGGTIYDVVTFAQNKCGDDFPEDFISKFRQRMFTAFESDLQPVPGVEDLIKSLGEQPKCVATNGPLEKVKSTLRITGLAQYFADKVFSAHEIDKFKPEPDLFLHAAESMGFAPDKTLVIEDSTNGIRAALAAGMTAVGYNPVSEDQSLQQVGAHKVFNNMKDLKDYLLD